MTEPRDTGNALRSTWERLEVPADLWSRDAADPAARACDEWIRGAWAAVQPEPSASRSPGGPARFRERPESALRVQVLRRVLPFAAAAAALFLWQVTTSTGPERPPELHEPPLEVALAPPSSPVIRPAIAPSGAIEARSGNVRLILLPETRSPESHPENPR